MIGVIYKLGPVGIPLGLCFFVMLIVISERLYFLTKRSFVEDKDLYESFLDEKFDELSSMQKNIREELLSCEIEKIKSELVRGMTMLRFFSVIAPMLGLLGTVFGMISIFGAISTSGMAITPATIAYGFEEAMYATAFGLVIGIVAAGFGLMFNSMIDSRLDRYILKYTALNASLDQTKSV